MKRREWIIPSILGLILVISLVWGYNESVAKNEYRTSLTNHYQRLYFDTRKHVENVQVSLSKALLSQSREQNVLLLSQIMNEAFFAQDKLAQIPVDQSDISKTQRFLTQAADYSYYLIQQHLNGEELTKKQRETLTSLQKNSAAFNSEFAKLQDKIAESDFVGKRTSSRQQRKIDEANKKTLQTSIINIEKTMGKSPELIYDGPFSEQVLNKKPRALGDKKINSKAGEKAAINFLGYKKVSKIEPFEEGKDIDNTARIPSYTYKITPENTTKDRAYYIGVSKTGGKIVWMANARSVGKSKLKMEEGQEKALKFLEEKGYKNMEPNYALRYDNVGIYNFAYKEDKVTVYPDIIKVKVALDNGEIVGFDASTYLVNHYDRNIPTQVKLTEEEAKEKVKIDFDIDSIRLAMIPKGKREVLCYEFKGKYEDSDFIVYINAENGNEEEILQIIKDENGVLTF